MFSQDVKSRLAAAFVSTRHTIGTCKDLVLGFCNATITRERILEVLTNVMDIMNQQSLEDVDVDSIEDGIVVLSELHWDRKDWFRLVKASIYIFGIEY
ncbi:hypothetical protein Clacol_008015 [Clathrus columnatus]|uniref:Uncharacterized protein n=1 Tax=Clathrus columnatus TaxID=1419009 RepID=A0AAV5AKU7_9AGAM|nr:hypothetical protein Clacol_008015 [Clathrus columnatus]